MKKTSIITQAKIEVDVKLMEKGKSKSSYGDYTHLGH